MSKDNLLRSKNILTIIFVALFLGILAFSISLWQTPRYKASVRLLAVFNQTDIDTYTASKTANYITGILSEVIYSDSFIDSVYKSNSKLINNLGSNKEKSQKIWKRQLKTKTIDNKGIIIIDAYGENRYQTHLLVATVSQTIINQHGIYDGSADRVTIKMIDAPTIYDSWSLTKIITNSLIGILAGLFIGFTFVIIFPEHRLFEFKPKKYKNRMNRDYQKSQNQKIPATAEEEIKQDAPTGRTTNNPWLEQYYRENSDNSDN